MLENNTNELTERTSETEKAKLVWYRRNMSIVEAYVLFWKNYFNFTGRARRKEFWYVILINFVIYIMSWIFAPVFDEVVFYYNYMGFTPVSIVYLLYSTASAIPMISLYIRRFHDIGKSGWNVLLFFIPVVNLIMFISLTSDGAGVDNIYGESPKYFLAASEE